MAWPAAASATASAPNAYVSEFGSAGTGNGEFTNPSWTAVNPVTGTVYVTDSTNDTVQAFSASGTYESTIGSSGSGDGQFTDPTGVAVDPLNGWVYVVDSGHARVEFFTSTGAYLGQFGNSGSPGELGAGPKGIAINPSTADVYVADTGNQQVLEYTWNGIYVTSFGEPPPAGTESDSFGAGGPSGVAVNPIDGEIYAADPANSRVLMIDPSDGSDSQFSTPVVVVTASTTVPLRDPAGVAIDPTNGDVYVVDSANDNVDLFSSDGTYLSQFGAMGASSGEFSTPLGAAVAPASGDLYVVDSANTRVEQFGPGAPSVTAPTCSAVSKLTANPITASTVTLTCTGPTGIDPFYMIVTPPAHGTLSGFNPYTGTVSYLPDPGYAGADSFSFTAADNGGSATPVSVAVAVGTASPPPPPPPPLPTLSKISLKGVPGKKTAALALTATAAKGQPELKTIKILLPGGFGFSKKALKRGLSVKSAHGAKLKFKFSLKGSALTIQLASPATVAVLKLATGTISLSKNKAKAIRKAKGKHVTAKLSLAVTNAKGTKTNFNEYVLAS
jgi:DNA-binding beta-propeller fold protein YncE